MFTVSQFFIILGLKRQEKNNNMFLRLEYYLFDLNNLSLLFVYSAGGNELSFNCFFAFSASYLVISSFLINLFVILAFSFDLIVLST
jgi:hypothetical protein